VPGFHNLLQFLIPGLALGALYAVSGTALVVLYRTTGVLNFALGAIGAFGVHIAWQLSIGPGLLGVKTGPWLAYLIGIVFCAAISVFYGRFLAPVFAQRDPLTRALGTLGILLICLGVMTWRWRTQDARSITLPMKSWKHQLGDFRVNGTQLAALLFGVVMTVGVATYLRRSAMGTAMRAVANDRDVAALLGIPVRRVESLAWLFNGVICGVVGLFISDLQNNMVATGLTFFVIPAIAAAVVGRLVGLWATFAGGLAIGVVEVEASGFSSKLVSDYRSMVPFLIGIGALIWQARKRTIVLSGRAMQ
jgi:branched-chain amino acid transport system permease protein